ncbi:MAG: hypothetical protein ITF98_01035 [Fermentimonas sp.]|nr:hypothetical protein [Fermentimonas sp.]
MRKYILSFIILIVYLVSCDDQIPSYNIPNSAVSFNLMLNSRDNILKNGLAYVTFTEKDRRLDSDRFGYGGLLVVTDNTGSAIYAYDLACPYEGKKNILIEPGDIGKVKCNECRSVFITIYGSQIPGRGMVGFGTAESGPAAKERISLKSYNVLPLQYGEFRIFN